MTMLRSGGPVADGQEAGWADAFLVEQVRSLEPFGFIVLAGPELPRPGVEVARDESGPLGVRLLPVDPTSLTELQRGALANLGLQPIVAGEAGTAWECSIGQGDATTAIRLVEAVLTEVFGTSLHGALDVRHGSHRAEVEAARDMEALRARIEPILTDLIGTTPTRDPDGDWVFHYGTIQAYVAPRVTTDGMVVVRVFAITNAGLQITPQLALFISSLNFGLAFCRFALDVQHGAVWVDETLLGNLVTDEELRFTIKMVASTAATWQGRIKDTFGGFSAQDVLSGRAEGGVPKEKPGQGGYL